eukprot:7007542-Alexandrium_andersonii.AAC.1
MQRIHRLGRPLRVPTAWQSELCLVHTIRNDGRHAQGHRSIRSVEANLRCTHKPRGARNSHCPPYLTVQPLQQQVLGVSLDDRLLAGKAQAGTQLLLQAVAHVAFA